MLTLTWVLGADITDILGADGDKLLACSYQDTLAVTLHLRGGMGDVGGCLGGCREEVNLVQGSCQILQTYGLEQVINAIVLECLNGIFVVCGDEDDRAVGHHLVECAEDKAVGEHDIGKDEVEIILAAQRFHHFVYGGEWTLYVCDIINLGEQAFQARSAHAFIFYNQDFIHGIVFCDGWTATAPSGLYTSHRLSGW